VVKLYKKEIPIMLPKTLLLCLVAVSPVLAADAKTVEAVKDADRAWAEATIKGDSARLQALLADDLTYTHSNGETDSKKVYIDNLRGARKYHKIEYETLEARLYLGGSMAVVNAIARFETSQKGGPVNPAHLRFVHVWVHQGGRWQLAAHQSLRLPN
jgi:ketosteroid isomerase-like protein